MKNGTVMPPTKKPSKPIAKKTTAKKSVAKKAPATIKKISKAATKKTSAKQDFIYEISQIAVTVPDASSKTLFTKPQQTTLISDVTFNIPRKSVLGVVGESGCGKTTLSRALMGLLPTSHGSLKFNGVDITNLNKEQMFEHRKKMSIIFQDPFSALNPRLTVGKTIAAPLEAFGITSDIDALTIQALENVGLSADYRKRYPHQLSGGQQQRVGIARGIITHPDFIVADEISSGLDVSTQAMVLDLINTLVQKLDITMLFVSHNLSVVRRLCDTVIVMNKGKIIEHESSADLFKKPKQKYTQELIDAIPLPETGRNWLKS